MNNHDFSIYIITALLPLSAFFLVIQGNPYQALIIRGILGAMAALVYAILGAGDVALTEALMGTLLAVSLYVIAVRSSLVFKLGILNEDFLLLKEGKTSDNQGNNDYKNYLVFNLIETVKKVINKYYLRLDLITYDDENSLKNALNNKEIHGICLKQEHEETDYNYFIRFRLQRLYEIFMTEKQNNNELIYVEIADKY